MTHTFGRYDTAVVGFEPKRTSPLAAESMADPPSAAPAEVAPLLLLAGFVAFSRKTLLPSFAFFAFFRPLFLSIVMLGAAVHVGAAWRVLYYYRPYYQLTPFGATCAGTRQGG